MTLDLEHVKRKNDNLTDTDDGTGSGVHNGLAGTLAKGVVELVAVVLCEVIANERLTTVLVDSLKDLVGCCVSETGEEREEAGSCRCIGLVLEDDLVELGGRGDLARG